MKKPFQAPSENCRGFTRKTLNSAFLVAVLIIPITFLCFYTENPGKAVSTRSRVVVVHNSNATDGTGGKDNKNLVQDEVAYSLNEGVKALTGASSTIEAWKTIIPDASKRVAIKVNCQITGIYTKEKVVRGIIDGLLERGVSEDNIIVYDRTDNAFSYAGFVKNTGPGVKIGEVSELGGYSADIKSFHIANFLGDPSSDYYCDYLINVPVLKALDGYAGVTLSMKNHFGTCSPAHGSASDRTKLMERIVNVNALEPIRNKTRLIVLDAVFGEYKWFNGRSQATVDIVNKLLLSFDPVALDYVGWQMINSLRNEHGLGPANPRPDYIDMAASAPFFLGDSKPDNIEIIELGRDTIFKRGDVNTDGEIHISDAVLLLNYLFASEPRLHCEDAADANDDGSLDVSDAIKILLYLFGAGGELPDPFRECGSDGVEDPLSCASFHTCL